jgi:HEAT repeat protein
LGTAESAGGYTLPASSTWQIQFIPTDEREYLIQYLLFGKDIFGNPNGQTHLYITYSYQREGCLSYFGGLSCDVEKAKIISRLYIKEGETYYVLEEFPPGSGGVGAHTWEEVITRSVYSYKALGEQAEDIEEKMGTLMLYVGGIDPGPNNTAYRVFQPALNARIAILKLVLSSPYWSDRRAALGSLSEVGPDAVDAVPEIINALHDEEDRVVGSAVSALGSIGPGAVASVPDLIHVFQEKDKWYSCDAAYALSNIGEGAYESIPLLITEIESKGKCLKNSINALGRFGTAGSPAVSSLVSLLNSENDEVRELAAEALGNIGEPASEAIPALINSLNDDKKEVWCEAVVALSKIGEIPAETAPALASLLDKGDCMGALIDTLELMGPSAAQAVPALIKILDHEFMWRSAVQALGAIGPAGIDAVPALIHMLETGNYGKREAAQKALVQIIGQDLGDQPEAWQKWWEENKP